MRLHLAEALVHLKVVVFGPNAAALLEECLDARATVGAGARAQLFGGDDAVVLVEPDDASLASEGVIRAKTAAMNVRWVIPVALLSGCHKCGEAKVEPKPEVKPAAVKPAPPAPAPVEHRERAEVEFAGSWKPGDVKAAKVLFVAQAEPCLPVPEKPTRYGETTLKEPGDFFDEYFIPQDSRGHVCLYGYDEGGRVVGAASWEKNPLRFFGEVVFAGIHLTLAGVK
jgi:hypothetical protein